MKKRRVMSMLLTAVMTVGSIAPEYVFAASGDENGAETVEVSVNQAEDDILLSGPEDQTSDEETTLAEDSGDVKADEAVNSGEIDLSDIEKVRYGTEGVAYDGVAYLSDDVLTCFDDPKIGRAHV